MAFKIQKKRKIPLLLRKRGQNIYCQCQYEVAGQQHQLLGICVEFFCFSLNGTLNEIGENVLMLLRRFHEFEDLELIDVLKMKQMSWEQYEKIRKQEIYSFFDVKDDVDMLLQYQECGVVYNVNNKCYTIDFTWYNNRKKYIEFSSSTGEEGILSFETPLEFDATILPEKLGKMVLEAFERHQQLTDAAAGNKFPKKQLTLLDETMLEVQMPRDKHFSDSEDMGVGELYQVYEYFPKEDSEDAQAQFFLGIGAELDCDLSEEHILVAWEKYHGKAEFFEVQEVKHGIYSLRAELRNKNVHKVSYFMPQNETLLLECSMELFQPGKRKKLDEKLAALFEEFAEKCRKK